MTATEALPHFEKLMKAYLPGSDQRLACVAAFTALTAKAKSEASILKRKEEGKSAGKSSLPPEVIETIVKLHDRGFSLRRIEATTGVSLMAAKRVLDRREGE